MDFQSKFEAERISRLEREGRILKQLADHEQEVATDFETERVRSSPPPVGSAHASCRNGCVTNDLTRRPTKENGL